MAILKTVGVSASAAARTVLDDETVSAMVNTLGGAASTGTDGLVRKTSPAFGTQISTPKIVTASGNLEITPAGNADVVLQGSGAGKVAVGFLTAPAVKLDIRSGFSSLPATSGTAQTGGLRIHGTSGTTQVLDFGIYNLNSLVWIQSTDSSDLAANGSLLLNPNGGNVGIGMIPTVQFELSGSIGQKASGTTWSNPSDERLKDIQGPADLQRCYDDVKALELKRYRVKDDCFTTEKVADRTVTGLVAGQVRKIIPKAVNVVPFTKVAVPDGTEEYEEQDFVMESVEVQEVKIIAGLPVLKVRTKEQKKMLTDEIQVKDDLGNLVVSMDDKGEQKPLMHSVPRMVKKTRPKERKEVIEDCLNLDMSQVYMQMFGTVQLLQLKVEALQAEIVTLRTV